ncbi:caprin-1-like isoform X2 [Syngnathoides biaculeatus]|uniref:caprin-1-like isoform X2 n=1 Tax=Syngnathoides biaculeatus TaxID=300417 RepID=UPI002ADD63E9|nr:caprin-1-like isoform X2 [Syngnathoides biaculeatus]
MPSAMVGNNAVKSANPDVGIVNQSQSDAVKQIIGVADKKLRNMEKKKSKLDDDRAKKSKGEKLNQDQLMPSAMVGNNTVQSAIPDIGNRSQSQSDAMKQVNGVVDRKLWSIEKNKMPSAMVDNNAVKSANPDVGIGSQSQSDAVRQIIGVVDKKLRNMEKKKSKLDDYQAKKSKGERLNQDQLEALSKYQEIHNNIDFARELQKTFLTLGQEIQKVMKKTARREQLQREDMEQQRLKLVLEVQFLLDQLGDDNVRQDLKRPDASGTSLLTDADLASLDEFYKLVGPDRNCDIRLIEQYKDASLHLWELLEGRDKVVAGTSYKSLKGIVDKLLQSGYFDRAQSSHNGTCEGEEEEEQEKQMVADDCNVGQQPSEPGVVTENHPEPVELETTEFINRQFIPQSTYSSTHTEHEEWSMDMQMVNPLKPQPTSQLSPEQRSAVNHVSPPPPTDPVVRKQVVQDLMAQMQGTYNFMQVTDSVLDFDGQALDPAIVSAQPMKPPGKTVDLQLLACVSSHSKSRLPQISATTGPKEPLQAAMSPSSEQPSASCSLSSGFPHSSTVSHTGGINVNAASFQSVQAVFNMSAPVVQAGSQANVLKRSQFPEDYRQSFSSQSEAPVDQPDIPQETLQSVVAGFQPQAQILPLPLEHEDSQPSTSFGQSGQSFYNSRAIPRGSARNTRGAMNGYRGSSNGFRGGYEGYRPPFSNPPSSGYGQSQFSTGARDYSSNTYQREGYQQGYKRGAGQGPRGLSRGNAQPMRS